jgi:hypothetical protein
MWKLGTRPRSLISGNICFKFSLQCLCSVGDRGDEEKRTGPLYNSALPVWSHANIQKINGNYWLVFNLSVLVMRGYFKCFHWKKIINYAIQLHASKDSLSSLTHSPPLPPSVSVYGTQSPILIILEVLPATLCREGFIFLPCNN